MLRALRMIAVCGVFAALPAMAAGTGTADEAKALMNRATEHAAKVGAEAAFKDFSDTKGAFVDRDLYIFCVNNTGDVVAHGANNALIGKNTMALKDSDGKEFVAEFIKVAASGGDVWVDYRWPNPGSKKIEPKSSFIRSVAGAACGVGIYK